MENIKTSGCTAHVNHFVVKPELMNCTFTDIHYSIAKSALSFSSLSWCFSNRFWLKKTHKNPVNALKTFVYRTKTVTAYGFKWATKTNLIRGKTVIHLSSIISIPKTSGCILHLLILMMIFYPSLLSLCSPGFPDPREYITSLAYNYIL